MPQQHDEGDRIYHRKYGVGTIIRKTGPTFVVSMSETMEATYLVHFPHYGNGVYIPSLYGNELRNSPIHHPPTKQRA